MKIILDNPTTSKRWIGKIQDDGLLIEEGKNNRMKKLTVPSSRIEDNPSDDLVRRANKKIGEGFNKIISWPRLTDYPVFFVKRIKDDAPAKKKMRSVFGKDIEFLPNTEIDTETKVDPGEADESAVVVIYLMVMSKMGIATVVDDEAEVITRPGKLLDKLGILDGYLEQASKLDLLGVTAKLHTVDSPQWFI